MRNINYFCSVKHFRVFITLIICIISFASNETYASNIQPSATKGDSVEISLLTCAPGKEVYSLYGHTAIRYQNKVNGIDVAINYGIFSFRAPFFILRFIFGLTDYEMGIIPFDIFCEEYRYANRTVTQQVLNLTTEEKKEIIEAIERNYLPENRVYRYNYFYDNCTTRARDILLNHIKGKVYYTNDRKQYHSFRELIHLFNENEPWARFGNDILLGVKADQKTTLNEFQFLPFNLMHNFENAKIKDLNNKIRPLTISQYDIVQCPNGHIDTENSFPLRPIECAWIIFGLVTIITSIEFFKKIKLWAFDVVLMLFDGIVGLIILMMFFSEHPTTSTNLQIFLFNPLALFYLYYIVQQKKKKRNTTKHFWFYSIVSLILFFIGGLFQDYAEGTYVLALSLLVRCISNIIQEKNNDK